MEKVVLTGATGFLGRSLLARLYGQVEITAFSRSEKAQLPLRQRYPEVRWLLGDVTDIRFVDRVFPGHDTVIHAGALKHVNLSEKEPTAYSQVNVLGSINVAEAANRHGLRAVGISTDKACNPRNVYGLTKLLMERIFAEHGHVSVRYGNVFGSDGSVLGVWERQINEDGYIRVTDPQMTRFFFPVESAVDEVLWTLENCPPRHTVIPRIGSARLMDLAVAFIQSRVGEHEVTVSTEPLADIMVIGQRAGEKRHESLLSEEEADRSYSLGGRVILHPSEHQKAGIEPILSHSAPRISSAEILGWMDSLEKSGYA